MVVGRLGARVRVARAECAHLVGGGAGDGRGRGRVHDGGRERAEGGQGLVQVGQWLQLLQTTIVPRDHMHRLRLRAKM